MLNSFLSGFKTTHSHARILHLLFHLLSEKCLHRQPEMKNTSPHVEGSDACQCAPSSGLPLLPICAPALDGWPGSSGLARPEGEWAAGVKWTHEERIYSSPK